MLDRDFYPASKSWSASLQLVRTSPRHLIPPPPACPKRSKLEFQPFGALWFVLFWTFQLWDPFCGRFSHFLLITSKPHRISNELLAPSCCFYLFACFSQKYYDLLTSDKMWMSGKLRSVSIQNVKMYFPHLTKWWLWQSLHCEWGNFQGSARKKVSEALRGERSDCSHGIWPNLTTIGTSEAMNLIKSDLRNLDQSYTLRNDRPCSDQMLIEFWQNLSESLGPKKHSSR